VLIQWCEKCICALIGFLYETVISVQGNYKNNIKVFYLPTEAQEICFKRILKFALKQLLHVSVQSPSSICVLFELAKFIVIKIIC
jgi:hypothetical protein